MAHDQPVCRAKLGSAQALADIARPPMMDVNARTFRGSNLGILKAILFFSLWNIYMQDPTPVIATEPELADRMLDHHAPVSLLLTRHAGLIFW